MERVFIKITSGWFKGFYVITWPNHNGSCEVYSRDPMSFDRKFAEGIRDEVIKTGSLVELVVR